MILIVSQQTTFLFSYALMVCRSIEGVVGYVETEGRRRCR